MIDFARLRQSMVDGQIRVNDVTDPRIVAAMLDLPRERFVPEARRELAYLDDDILIQPGGQGRASRYLIEPMVLAKLVQALEIDADARVLDVGCATGYAAALLARLGAEVFALEEEPELAQAAARALGELEIGNVRVVTGALAAGWPAAAPYDAILIEGAVETVPDSLLAQLKPGGRLDTVVRSGAANRATIFARAGGTFAARPIFDAAIPPLPGFSAPKGFVF